MIGSQALRRPQTPFAPKKTLWLNQNRIVYIHPSEKRLRWSPTVPRGGPVPRGQGNGGLPFRRRADSHVAGSRPAERGNDRVMKNRMDVRVFQGGRKQTPEPWAIPPSKLEAPVDYNQTAERVPEAGAVRPFYGDLSKGILHVHLAQQDAGKGCRRATQVQDTPNYPSQHVS